MGDHGIAVEHSNSSRFRGKSDGSLHYSINSPDDAQQEDNTSPLNTSLKSDDTFFLHSKESLSHPSFKSESDLLDEVHLAAQRPPHGRAHSVASSLELHPTPMPQQKKKGGLKEQRPPSNLAIPVPLPRSDRLSFTSQYASELLYWQYIAAFSGLGAFGRRVITMAFLVCSLTTAFSLQGPALYVILGLTALLMAADITYISMFGHKDRYTIKRSQLKFYQAEVEYWAKGHKDEPEFTDFVKFSKHLRTTKEESRIVLVHFSKINKIQEVLDSGWKDNDQSLSPISISKTLASLSKIYCPELDTEHMDQATLVMTLRNAINQKRLAMRQEIKNINVDLEKLAERLKQDRLPQIYDDESIHEFREHIKNVLLINKQTQELFQPYFTKLNITENEHANLFTEEEDNEDHNEKIRKAKKALRKTIYHLLTTDALVRRLLSECEIDVDLLAKEYHHQKKISLEALLIDHYFKKTGVYERRYKKKYKAIRALTFGQFLKVGFRSFSLIMVIMIVLYQMQVYTPSSFAPILYIAAGITAFGLLLGFGNAYVQRNKEDVINLYSQETSNFREFERRDKFVCLIQIIDRKLHYAPTRKLDEKVTRSKEIAALKKEFCYKVVPIFLLAGSLARRSFNLQKLSKYVPAFHNELALGVIVSGLLVFLVYDLVLSLLNIHKKHHTLDMYEQSHPNYASDNPNMQNNDILDAKINAKVERLMAYKNDPNASFHAIGDMEKPLTSILGDDGVAERMVKKLSAHYDSVEELKQALYSVLDQDPRLPEQYKDNHPQRDAALEQLEALQVFKPTFRVMSVGGSVMMAAPNSSVNSIAITSLMAAFGVPILFDVPVFFGAIIGAVIGFALGVWLYKLDMKEEKILDAHTKTPEIYHRTLIRRMINDTLDAVLLNSFTAPSANDTKRPFRIRSLTPYAKKPTQEVEALSNILPEAERSTASAMAGGY